MNILHTSDWHLGISMYTGSCEEEQTRFLQWLLETINERRIELLLIAGDIFHHRNPANSARRLFYDFLASCEEETDLRSIVIVAGNHDSPSGLEAPQELLKHLNVSVVGSVQADPETWSHLLIPIRDDSGAPRAVIAAVPYVSEVRLGISGIGKEPRELRHEFIQGFQKLYSTLAEQARRDYGEIPLIATGHLTCYEDSGDAQDDDYHSPIHQVGTIESLSPDVFDPRFDYVALGHIHRMFPVDRSQPHRRIWYSGTPVPTSVTETTSRFVLQVHFDAAGTPPKVEPLKVPSFRDIFSLKGTTTEVLAKIPDLSTDKDLSPYLTIRLINQQRDPSARAFDQIQEALTDAFSRGPSPRIVEFQEVITGQMDAENAPAQDLNTLSPEEVFSALYQRVHGAPIPPDEILQAFRELLTEPDEEEEEQLLSASIASTSKQKLTPEEV